MAERLRSALLFVAVAALAAHLWRFHDFTVDDAAISYAYARNWALGRGLVAIAGGERVEGYSNFLWVALLAGAARLGLDVVVAAKLWAAALATAMILGVAELTGALRGRRGPLDGVAALLCASLLPVVYWCMSGLETPLYLALGVWCAARLVRELDEPSRRPLSALCAAGLALTRPDGWLMAAAAAAARLLGDRRPRRLVVWGALAALPVAAHLAFRLRYYAWPFPNTFYAKVREPFHARELWHLDAAGWRYVRAAFARYQLAPTALLAAVALARRTRARPRLVVGLFAAAALFFPLYARGDWMSESRFVVPLLPLLVALAVDGAERLAALVARSRLGGRQPWIAAALAALLFAWGVPTSLRLSRERAGRYDVTMEAVAARARMYTSTARALEVDRPSVMEGDLGGNSLYATMPVIDMGALTDATFAHHIDDPTALREYVLGERRPTFAMLVGNWSLYHFQEHDEFVDRYIPWRAPGLRSGYWIARAVFTGDEVRTRLPLHRFSSVDLLGAHVDGDVVRLWLLVREPARKLTLGGVELDGLFPRALWRPGEIVRAIVRRPAGAPRLCEDPVGLGPADCFALADGHSWSHPVQLASPPFLTTVERLEQRARSLDAAGDVDRAFRDWTSVLEHDPTRALARRRIEELRLVRREPYHARASLRLDAALRAFHLEPDGAHLSRLAAAALADGDVATAVRAHQAAQLDPGDDAGRLDLADAHFAVGEEDAAADLLPKPVGLDDAARILRIARAADRQELVAAATAVLSQKNVRVAPGVTLTAAWATLLRSGRVELALALRGDGATSVAIGGRPSPFDRAIRAGELYVHRLRLELPPGRSTLTVGDATLTVELDPFVGNFETGRLDGWSGTMPIAAEHGWETRARSYEGSRYLDSFAGRDAATFELRSPPLAQGLDEACFLVGGGSDENEAVALEADGRVVARRSGRGDDQLREACIDLPRGRALRLVVRDGRGGPFGHVLADDFECFAGGRPTPCAGSVSVSLP
jgi:hypothetical protein